MFDVPVQAAIGSPRHRARDDQRPPQGRAREVLRRRHHAEAEAAREAEEGQEADEAGRRRRGAPGGVPGGAQPRHGAAEAWERSATCSDVHLPFCAHRCGYCDFVTVVGRRAEHSGYVDARSLAELELERHVLVDPVETVFLGGGTPTFTRPSDPRAAARRAPDRRGGDGRGEPGDNDPRARQGMLRGGGVNRVSLGAQSAWSHLLSVLEREAGPGTTSGARCTLSVMPDSTTSRSISCTASPARAPPTSRPIRRRARARAGAPLLLRARGEARHTLHARARGRPRRASRRARGAIRARRRHAGRQPATAGTRRPTSPGALTRRRAGPPRPAQPRLLERARLPRRRARRGLHGRRRASPQRTRTTAVRGGPARWSAAAARARAPG